MTPMVSPRRVLPNCDPQRTRPPTCSLSSVTCSARLADAGYTHGDLSPYNVLVHDGRLVLIDLPQAVDLVGNPQGFTFLRRDCDNICTWFQARGVAADPSILFDDLMLSLPRGVGQATASWAATSACRRSMNSSIRRRVRPRRLVG